MSRSLFMFVVASLASLLGSAMTYGLIPHDYAGLVAALATGLAAMVRPPEKS